jgi:cell division protein FtsW (lipid II flippase)
MGTTNFDLDINPLFIFYVTLGGNFVAQLFPCQVQKLFTENIYYKHFLAFFILFFAIVLTSDKSEKITTTLLLKTFVLYSLFIILTRMDKNFFLLFFVTLCIKFIIINEMTHTSTSKELKDKYDKINKALNYALISIGVIGFILYYGEKRYEYGKRFNFLTFLMGKPVCREFIIPTNYRRNLTYAFTH